MNLHHLHKKTDITLYNGNESKRLLRFFFFLKYIREYQRGGSDCGMRRLVRTFVVCATRRQVFLAFSLGKCLARCCSPHTFMLRLCYNPGIVNLQNNVYFSIKHILIVIIPLPIEDMCRSREGAMGSLTRPLKNY